MNSLEDHVKTQRFRLRQVDRLVETEVPLASSLLTQSCSSSSFVFYFFFSIAILASLSGTASTEGGDCGTLDSSSCSTGGSSVMLPI